MLALLIHALGAVILIPLGWLIAWLDKRWTRRPPFGL